MHIRLARRKNKPTGSTLVRKCACRYTGDKLCVVHAVEHCLANKNVGDRVFEIPSAAWLTKTRRLLALLSHTGASLCTLKGYRAGHTTSLAASGHTIGDILAAGEWRSISFLRYCHADELSVPALIVVVFEADED